MATAGASRPLSGPTKTPSPSSPDLDRDGPAGGAHAGVDDRQHDPWGEVLDGADQGEAAGPHVVGRQLVAEVDHGDVRARCHG